MTDEELTEQIMGKRKRSHSLPFGQYRKTTGFPTWNRAGGYVVVTDGSPENLIMPGMVYGITVRDGKPMLDSFWLRDYSPTMETMRPYTLAAIKHHAYRGRLEVMIKGLNARSVGSMVRPVYPKLRIPDNETWAREFGIGYDAERDEFYIIHET